MTDWVYVASEGNYNQDFILFNQSTGEKLDLTGATVTMFIQTSDFQTDFPSSGDGTPMVVTTNDEGEQVARLTVQSSFMPQVEDIYVAQVKVDETSIVRSFIINLRVVRQIGNA